MSAHTELTFACSWSPKWTTRSMLFTHVLCFHTHPRGTPKVQLGTSNSVSVVPMASNGPVIGKYKGAGVLVKCDGQTLSLSPSISRGPTGSAWTILPPDIHRRGQETANPLALISDCSSARPFFLFLFPFSICTCCRTQNLGHGIFLCSLYNLPHLHSLIYFGGETPNE